MRACLLVVFSFLVEAGLSWSYAEIPEQQLDGAPPRSVNAISGSEFARRTTGMSGDERQSAAVEELSGGNVPAFLRTLKRVRITGQSRARRTTVVEFLVTPDYLAIGSDEDFLRIPLSYPSATTIANRFEAVLPTSKMVDAIYASSTCRLAPAPLAPGRMMRSSQYYLGHRHKIESQRVGKCALGELVSGHKKDLVLTNRLHRYRGRVAIYGWHRKPGDPIQPLSTVHGAHYADYSHGLRLVSRRAWVDGEPRLLLDVLQDPDVAALLSYSGEIINPQLLMSAQR